MMRDGDRILGPALSFPVEFDFLFKCACVYNPPKNRIYYCIYTIFPRTTSECCILMTECQLRVKSGKY